MQQRTVLKHMGINVWQRHDPGQSDSARPSVDTEADNRLDNPIVVDEHVANANDLENGLTSPAENNPANTRLTNPTNQSEKSAESALPAAPLPGVAVNFPPASFSELLAMVLAAEEVERVDGKILVLCPPATESADGKGMVLSGDALRLLQKMMMAIGLTPGDWSQLALSSPAIHPQGTAAVLTLQELLNRKRIPALLLLLPQQMISQAQQGLTAGCDNAISTQQSAASGQSGVRVLAGKLPSTRCVFCCLHAPADLLANGALKRDAWMVLKALRECLSAG